MLQKSLHRLGGVLALGILAGFSPILSAETVVATTETAGTVSEFSPDALVIRTETDPAPVRYVVGREVTYVDDAGVPVGRRNGPLGPARDGALCPRWRPRDRAPRRGASDPGDGAGRGRAPRRDARAGDRRAPRRHARAGDRRAPRGGHAVVPLVEEHRTTTTTTTTREK